MDIAAFIALPFLAFLGAWTSKRFRRAGATGLVFVPPLVSFTVGWGSLRPVIDDALCRR